MMQYVLSKLCKKTRIEHKTDRDLHISSFQPHPYVEFMNEVNEPDCEFSIQNRVNKIEICNHKSDPNGKYEAILYFHHSDCEKSVKFENENLDVLIKKMDQFIKSRN